MINAAVMFIVNFDGCILGVSRKTDSSKFGLPGGKLEKWESFKDAAIRETFEETNVKVNDCELFFIRGDSRYIAYCYYAVNWTGIPKSSEEGIVKWVKSEVLTDPNSAYPEYNTAAIAKFKSKYPNIHIL